MSRDWFDPLGLRGGKLDPFTLFTNALRGEGLAQQSAETLARAVAQRLVGRRVEVDWTRPIDATVERIDEVVPATALAAVPKKAGEVPMWRRVRGRLSDISVGDRSLSALDMTVSGVCLVGTTQQQMRVDRVEFNATVELDEVARWAAAVDGAIALQVNDGRLEVTDRRLEKWAWVEISVRSAAQRIVVTPVALRVFGRVVPMPRRLRRTIERPAPWLPVGLEVEEVRVTDHVVGVRGGFAQAVVPVDVARLLTDLSTDGTKSALRVVMGGW